MEDKPNPTNLGVVVAVRGSVVDIRFDGHLPPIYSVLRAGGKGRIVIEVQAQRDEQHVRGIATPRAGKEIPPNRAGANEDIHYATDRK
jgi:F-type H+/Na+-transporting ATPase subunit beta